MNSINILECIGAIQAAKSLEELLGVADSFAKSQGFDYFSYGHRVHAPFSASPTMHNNYPELWQSIYQDRGYINHDPLVKHAMKSSAPLIWSTQDNAFSEASIFQEELMGFDIKSGWCQSTRSTVGISLLTFAHSHTSLSCSDINTPELMWFTQAFNNALEELISSLLLVDTDIYLTSREIDVTRWTADGKTSYEIAVILGISERTVNFHLNNMMEKLSANNRISATVKAISLGLI